MEAGLIVVQKDEVEKVRGEVAPVLEAAKAVVVQDEESFCRAMELGQECSARSKRVEDLFRPARESTHKAWKTVTELIASFVGPLDTAKKLCVSKANRWRQEEQTRRQREADELRRREQQRIDEERLAAAIEMEKAGMQAQAEEVINKPDPAPIIDPVRIETPKGTSYRENWQAEVTDLRALVIAVATGNIDADVLMPNQSVLLKRAKALKSAMQYPGVRVWDEGAVAFRGR